MVGNPKHSLPYAAYTTCIIVNLNANKLEEFIFIYTYAQFGIATAFLCCYCTVWNYNAKENNISQFYN